MEEDRREDRRRWAVPLTSTVTFKDPYLATSIFSHLNLSTLKRDGYKDLCKHVLHVLTIAPVVPHMCYSLLDLLLYVCLIPVIAFRSCFSTRNRSSC